MDDNIVHLLSCGSIPLDVLRKIDNMRPGIFYEAKYVRYNSKSDRVEVEILGELGVFGDLKSEREVLEGFMKCHNNPTKAIDKPLHSKIEVSDTLQKTVYTEQKKIRLDYVNNDRYHLIQGSEVWFQPSGRNSIIIDKVRYPK